MDPKQLRVLIAEDDYLVALLIEEELRQVGISVAGRAADGQEAVELTCRLSPSAVLMDAEMPGMNGIEATREIQKLHPTPVVLLTAHSFQDAAGLAAQAGAGAYLTKPATGQELLEAIEAAAAKLFAAQAAPAET